MSPTSQVIHRYLNSTFSLGIGYSNLLSKTGKQALGENSSSLVLSWKTFERPGTLSYLCPFIQSFTVFHGAATEGIRGCTAHMTPCPPSSPSTSPLPSQKRTKENWETFFHNLPDLCCRVPAVWCPHTAPPDGM